MLAVLAALVAAAAAPESRTFTIKYTARIASPPAGQPLDLFLPLPAETPEQRVDALRIEASGPFEGTQKRAERYGNRFWHGRIERAPAKPLEVSVVATIERRAIHAGKPANAVDLERYLQPDRLVPLSGAPLEKIDAEIARKLGDRDGDPAAAARAIYDWVVDNVEYKKAGTGWGNGDTFWACSAKYGNCTDFHALVISLARRRGIPARFYMGFPIPLAAKGKVAGYHCWVELHLPGRGWIPIDASEARKDPSKRELLFGGQPADRVQLSEGRDLELPGMQGEPLNYFVYPHLEVAGTPSKLVTWELEFTEQARASPAR